MVCRQFEGGKFRLSVESYVRILLKKKNMSQRDLLRKMQELKLTDYEKLYAQHLNYAITTKMTYLWARRIELALELPDYSLVAMVGNPSQKQWESIRRIKTNEQK